jgi:hypothetical protein
MTKRMKRRLELAEKEEEKRQKKKSRNPFAMLRRFSLFRSSDPERKSSVSPSTDAEKSPTKSEATSEAKSESKSRPTTASSSTQTRQSTLRKALSSLNQSPAKSSMKQPNTSTTTTPNKTPKKVTLVTYKEPDTARQQDKEEEFLAIEITHSNSVEKEGGGGGGGDSIKIHSGVISDLNTSPARVSSHEAEAAPKDSRASKRGDAGGHATAWEGKENESLEEFEFEHSPISRDSTVVNIDVKSAKTEEVSVNMEKYIRPPTRDTPRPVSRPITAGGGRKHRPSTAGTRQQQPPPQSGPGVAVPRRSTKS